MGQKTYAAVYYGPGNLRIIYENRTRTEALGLCRDLLGCMRDAAQKTGQKITVHNEPLDRLMIRGRECIATGAGPRSILWIESNPIFR